MLSPRIVWHNDSDERHTQQTRTAIKGSSAIKEILCGNQIDYSSCHPGLDVVGFKFAQSLKVNVISVYYSLNKLGA